MDTERPDGVPPGEPDVPGLPGGVLSGEPSSPPQSTGDPRVDEAVAGLDRLRERPLDEHPAVLESVHDKLREILGELGDAGARPAEPQPGRPGQRGEQGQLSPGGMSPRTPRGASDEEARTSDARRER